MACQTSSQGIAVAETKSSAARSRYVCTSQVPSKRPSVNPERSESSAISGVSLGPRGRGSSNEATPVVSKPFVLASDVVCPSAKRHCSDGFSSAGAKKKFSNKCDRRMLAGESDITSAISCEGMQETVEDPLVNPARHVATSNGGHLSSALFVSAASHSRTTPASRGVDPAAPNLAISSASTCPDQATPEANTVPDDKTEGVAKSSDQDSLSESAPDGPEASEQQGTQGTVSSGGNSPKSTPSSKRKVKVDWSPELHRKFVQAVEQLGVEKAIPSRILEIMNVKCLTRHNIASHLQKYRSHRRHLAAREADAANWQQRKVAEAPLWPAAAKPSGGPFSWGSVNSAAVPAASPPAFVPGMPHTGPTPGRPVVGVPPHMFQGVPMGAVGPMPPMGSVPLAPLAGMAGPGVPPMAQVQGQSQPQSQPVGPAPPALGLPMPMPMPMHVWGHPTVDHSQAHMWQCPGMAYPMPPPTWHCPDGSSWQYPTPFQPAPAVDMWGHTVPGYPGAGGMVPGMPCFAPQPQPLQMQGIPQRVPSGVSMSGPIPGMPGTLGQPGSKMTAVKSETMVDPPLTPGPAASVSAAVNSAESLAEDVEADGSLDAFLDEALPEAMFDFPEDMSLNLAYKTFGKAETQPPGLIDAAINEALNNPSTPLPLGLKPPSVDGVLEELNKQGITMLPPLKGSSARPVDIKAVLLGEGDLLGEVDDHALMLAEEIGEDTFSEEALNALLQP